MRCSLIAIFLLVAFQIQANNVVDEKTYEAITKSQALIEKASYTEAQAVLDRVNLDRLGSYGKAHLHGAYAYLYSAQEKYLKAESSYAALLAESGATEVMRKRTLYHWSYLCFIREDYQCARQKLNDWFEEESSPSQDAFALLAQIYYQLENFTKAISAINSAIEIAEHNSVSAPEGWYQLKASSHYQNAEYAKATKAMKVLAARYPRVSYIKQLAQLHAQNGQPENQLVLISALHQAALLQSAQERRWLAQLYAANGMPFHAAQLQSQFKNSGERARNTKAQMWLSAGELEKALTTYGELADGTTTGEYNATRAELYLRLGRYQQVVEEAKLAIEKGGLGNKPNLLLILGAAQLRLADYQSALQSFRQAKAETRVLKKARSWEKYTLYEIERQEKINALLRELDAA